MYQHCVYFFLRNSISHYNFTYTKGFGFQTFGDDIAIDVTLQKKLFLYMKKDE